MKRLLDRDPFTGVTTWHHYDETNDETVIEYEQDAEPVLDANAKARNESIGKAKVRAGASHLTDSDRVGIENSWMKVASIPPVVEMAWRKEGIDIWKYGRCDWTTKKITMKLNSPEYRYLRTGNAKL